MDEPAQPSHDALPFSLPLATPPSTNLATPPTAPQHRDQPQPDAQEERGADESDVLGLSTAAMEVCGGKSGSREGEGEVGGDLVGEGAAVGASRSGPSSVDALKKEQMDAQADEEKEPGEIDQVEASTPKEEPYKWQSSGIVPHTPPTIMDPFGTLLTLEPRSANQKMVDPSVYSDKLPGRPPPHRTPYEYRLFLPFRSIGNSLIGPRGLTILDIRKKSRLGVTQVLFTKEDRKGVLIMVGSLASIRRALEIIEDHVYRKEWGCWNPWELGKLQSTSSDWVRFVPERATEVPGLWLKPAFADDDPRACQAPSGGGDLLSRMSDEPRYRRDQSLPPRPPPAGRRASYPPAPTRQPQRYDDRPRGPPNNRDARSPPPPRNNPGPSQPRSYDPSRRPRSPDRRPTTPPHSSPHKRGSRRTPSPDKRNSRARTERLTDDEDDHGRRRSSRSRSPVRSRIRSESNKSRSPERPRGPTRSLLAVKEQEDEEPPTSYSIDIGDESALHFFGPNSCAPYIQTTTGSKVTVEASGVHVKVKVEGGDVQKAVEKVREVVASTGGKIGGVAAGRKEVTKVVVSPVKPDVPPVSPKKRRYSSATTQSHDSPETSFSSRQTADTSSEIDNDMNWVAREADLKEQVVKRMKERDTSTSGSVTPVEEPARWRGERRNDRPERRDAPVPNGPRFARRASIARRSPLPLPPHSSAFSSTGRSYTHYGAPPAPASYPPPQPAFAPSTDPYASTVPRWLNGDEQAFYDAEFRTKGWGWGSNGWHQSYSYEENKARKGAKKPKI
ncbi:hypothetical protein JCM10049v2_007366 [Rhodotorula toruloides]